VAFQKPAECVVVSARIVEIAEMTGIGYLDALRSR
jgi:hypothetical protein